MTLLRVNEYFVMRIDTKHNQRQEYYNKAALLNTYKSLQSCQRIKQCPFLTFYYNTNKRWTALKTTLFHDEITDNFDVASCT